MEYHGYVYIYILIYIYILFIYISNDMCIYIYILYIYIYTTGFQWSNENLTLGYSGMTYGMTYRIYYNGRRNQPRDRDLVIWGKPEFEDDELWSIKPPSIDGIQWVKYMAHICDSTHKFSPKRPSGWDHAILTPRGWDGLRISGGRFHQQKPQISRFPNPKTQGWNCDVRYVQKA